MAPQEIEYTAIIRLSPIGQCKYYPGLVKKYIGSQITSIREKAKSLVDKFL
jgi:hypothetical protein